MATTENTFTGNGSTTNYSFTFPYIKSSDVKVSVNGTDITEFTVPTGAPTTVQFNTAPANSAAIRIYRVTDDSALPATFYAGSSIKSSDLNDNFLQNLYNNQETNNNVWQTGTETIDSSETWAGNNTKIATTGAIDGRVDAKIDTALGSDVLAGTDLIKTVSGGQVTVAHNVNGANSTVNNSNGSVVQDITISAQGHVTSVGSIDLDGRYYTETELNAGQLDNRYYTETETGSLIDSKIDTAVTTDILAGQSITKTNGSGQVTISIANGAIGTNQIADDAVTLAKLGSGALPTDITVASANIVNGTIVDADISTGTLDGRYYTETELNAGQLDTRYYTETELNAGQLDNRYYTETELNAGQLDSRYYTETEADARFYNLTSGEEIQSGETWSAADNKIATTAAIDARITDLVDDVGGFVPIANETSFPNANPDINNGAGTLVSIKALSSNLTSNGSGVATVTNGTVGNSTVTINGLDNSTTYNAGFGMIVETTTTLNTYTFHRQVPKATEVTTVAGSITNVNNVGNNISNVNTVAGVTSNVTTVAGISSNVTTVAGIASNVTTVAGISSDITAVAADATDIGAVAAKATEIGRLGTADAVSDMNTLGTTAIVSDLDTCATNISNINNVGGSISNVNTVAGNLSGVNSFGERYRVASSAPGSGNDEGDLYFDTTANELKVYNGSAWQGGVTASGNFASTTGNTFTGSNTYQDNVKAQFGTSNEFDIFHDSSGHTYMTNSAGNVHIQNPAGENSIRVIPNGAVELYYDGSKKLETASDRVNITGHMISTGTVKGTKLSVDDNNKATFGDGDDLQIYHQGSSSYIEEVGTGSLKITTNGTGVDIQKGSSETIARFIADGAVELYYDNAKKFETTSYGTLFTGNSKWVDNGKATFGDGDDLQIYHSGTNSIIREAGTGELSLQTNGTGIRFWDYTNQVSLLNAVGGYQVELFYDGSKKVETYSSGIKLNGTSNVWIQDNGSLVCGASSDLLIHHSSSNGLNYIDSKNRDLLIRRTGSATESMAQFAADGAVELFFDGSKKFETVSGGIKFTGDIYGDDSAELRLGNSGDLQIYHDGNNSYINDTGTGRLKLQSNVVQVRNSANTETIAEFIENSSVELYYDNAKKFETLSAGVKVSGWIYIPDSDGSNNMLRLGNGADLQIYHDGSNSWIKDAGAGNLVVATTGVHFVNAGNSENHLKIIDNGAVELYYNGSKKFETTSEGVNIDGSRMYFTTSHNRELRFEGKSQGRYIKFQHWDDGGTAESFIETTANNSTILYYDGSDKLATTSAGVTVTGNVNPAATNTHDLGTSSLRWNNVYVNDMHFSNHPDNPNSVDGTWGDWTLQEGENDIFMLNNRTGKKYKMALTEVS